MSSVMIATTAAIIAASAASNSGGSGGSCPVTGFGATCLAIMLIMLVLGGITLFAAMTRHWMSKWTDRWFLITVTLWVLSLVPMIAGMVHDCQ